MDESKIEGFQERLFTELNAGLSMLNLQLGYHLGLFQVLSSSGPIDSDSLAEETGYSERYLREWLECMAAGGYLDYDPETGNFSLPIEHSEVLTNPDGRWSAMGVLGWLSSFGNLIPQLAEAFRSGGGVPYEEYGQDLVTAQGMSTRPMFVNDYVSNWIPALPDIQAKLEQGARVADVGCGVGWSSIALAKGFSRVHIDGIDPDQLSIEEARRIADQEGLSDRIEYHIGSIEDADVVGPYQLITAFEVLHDMPYPVLALQRMRELLDTDGVVLVADEAVGDSLGENMNFMGHFFYNFSVLHCLPQAMSFPDAAGTGTIIKPSVLSEYAERAGYRQVEVLPIENPQFRFYRLAP